MSLIKCPECGKDISDKAQSCPNCGYVLNNFSCKNEDDISKVKTGKKTGLFVFAFIFVFAIASGTAYILFFSQHINNNIQKEISGVSSEQDYITLDEYNQIEIGMSYDDVIKITGSPGIISSETELQGYKTLIITWYGNGIAGSNANVTFTNNEVTGKAQVGLTSDYSAILSPTSSPKVPQISTGTITIPALYVDNLQFDIPTGDFIVNSCKNEDGSFTIEYVEDEYEAFLAGFRQSITDRVDSMKSEENSPYESISYNENLSLYEFVVCAVPPDADADVLCNIVTCSAYYQLLSGTPDENIDVIVTLTNSLSGHSTDPVSWKNIRNAIYTSAADPDVKETEDKLHQSPNKVDNDIIEDEVIVYYNEISSEEPENRYEAADYYIEPDYPDYNDNIDGFVDYIE